METSLPRANTEQFIDCIVAKTVFFLSALTVDIFRRKLLNIFKCIHAVLVTARSFSLVMTSNLTFHGNII